MKKFLIVLLCIVVVIGGAGAVVFFKVNNYLNKINRVEDDIETIPAAEEYFETDVDELNADAVVMDPDSIVWDAVSDTTVVTTAAGSDAASDNDSASAVIPSTQQETKAPDATPSKSTEKEKTKLTNILLVGQDRRPGEGRSRSDAMILCSINTKTGKVSMISFLRDLYVQIPGYSDNKLNATYVFGGFPLLKEALYKNFGVNVDACFEVDFNGFMALIDQVGGVDINLTAEEVVQIGKGTHEGLNHLDGRSALAYARIRKIGTDFARTNRQRTVLLAVYDKLKDKSITELLDMVETALPYVTTDMSNSQIYSLAAKLLPMVRSVSISTYHVPPEGTYQGVFIRKMYVLFPDLTAIRNILETEYLPY